MLQNCARRGSKRAAPGRSARKAGAAKAPKKKAPVAKRPLSAKARAGVTARAKTIEAVVRREPAASLKVDPDDEAACAVIAGRCAATREAQRRSAVDRLNDPPPAVGAMLIERVSRAIERELTQIEAIVGGSHVNKSQRSEGERRARTLASLARTLREVMLLRAGDRKAKGEDDDAAPRDLGELRLALARRLDQLVADAKAAHPEQAD